MSNPQSNYCYGSFFRGDGAYHIFTGEKQKYMWSVRRLDFAWIWMKNREYSIAFHINPAFFFMEAGVHRSCRM